MKSVPGRFSLLPAALLLLGLSAQPPRAFGQLTAELLTDKTEYAYGESISVTFKLSNPTSENIKISSSCPPIVTFDGIEFNYICLPAEIFYDFNPAGWRSWTFDVDPTVLGLPAFTGEHLIGVATDVYSESTNIQAPMYLGGTIQFEFIAGTPTETVDTIRNALNGTVIRTRIRTNGNLSETWTIAGMTVEQAAVQYENHAAVVNIYSDRPFVDITSVELERTSDVPTQLEVLSAYPNPASDHAAIEYSITVPAEVFVGLFDVTGREVRSGIGRYRAAGRYTELIELGNLPGGVYLYRVRIGNAAFSRPIVVLR